MRQSKNILTEKEMKLVSPIMAECQSREDIQFKLNRLSNPSKSQSAQNVVLSAKLGRYVEGLMIIEWLIYSLLSLISKAAIL